MGKELGQGAAVTQASGSKAGRAKAGPSKAAEALVAMVLPPACREEVLGDLYERYGGPARYGVEALRTIPMVIGSRIARTADPQVLLIQAFALYVSFLGAARWQSSTILVEPWGLLRLAIPAAMAIAGMVFEDAYARPGRRSALKLSRGPAVGLGLALLSQEMLEASYPELALPRAVAVYGCGMSLLLCSAVRLLFPPVMNQLQGVNAPALWLKRGGGSDGALRGITLALQGIATVVAAAMLGTLAANQFGLPRPRAIFSVLLLLIAGQLWKRS
jgi:hypothetical protein